MRRFGAAFIFLFGLGFVIYALNQSQSDATPHIPMPVAAVAPLVKPPAIKLGQMDRSYGLLEGAFTLTNPNKFAIADIEIACQVTAASGTVIGGYRFTLYQNVAAQKSKTVQGHKFGLWPEQGKSLSCTATGARHA